MSEIFDLKPTEKEPYICLNRNGSFEIGGICIPENAFEFFSDTLDWLEDYTKTPKSETKMEVRLHYFNTSSASALLRIFQLLNTMVENSTTKLVVNWYCEEGDYSMQESAEDYAGMFNFDFNVIEVMNLDRQH